MHYDTLTPCEKTNVGSRKADHTQNNNANSGALHVSFLGGSLLRSVPQTPLQRTRAGTCFWPTK